MVAAELMRRFRQHTQRRAGALPLRTAGELRARAEAIAERRRKSAREREARERAAREREEQTSRDRYLTHLAKRERQAWQRVDALIGTRRSADYAAAVELLVELREVIGRKGRGATFAKHSRALRRGAHEEAKFARTPSEGRPLTATDPDRRSCTTFSMAQCRIATMGS
jgi:hypothetical protein